MGALLDKGTRQMFTKDFHYCLIATEASDINRTMLVSIEDLISSLLQQLIYNLLIAIECRPMQRSHTQE